MSARMKKWTVDVLGLGGWPERKIIGPKMIVGRDSDGHVCVAEVGVSVLGRVEIAAFVELNPKEVRALRAFLVPS